MSTEQDPRRPKCSRCRHHGIIVPQKGHSKVCPYLKCVCWKCHLITERTRIANFQRNLCKDKKKYKDQHPLTETSDRTATPVPDGGATPSATSTPRPAVTSDPHPLDLRYRPADGGETAAGLAGRNRLPLASGEGGSSTPLIVPYFDQRNQTPPLPVLSFPLQMPGSYPNNLTPQPNFLLSMVCIPAVDLYISRLPGPVMSPHFQPSAMHYPPPHDPGPPSDYRE